MVCGEIDSLDMGARPVAAGPDVVGGPYVVDGLFHVTTRPTPPSCSGSRSFKQAII